VLTGGGGEGGGGATPASAPGAPPRNHAVGSTCRSVIGHPHKVAPARARTYARRGYPARVAGAGACTRARTHEAHTHEARTLGIFCQKDGSAPGCFDL
jgi:hypothetical protein